MKRILLLSALSLSVVASPSCKKESKGKTTSEKAITKSSPPVPSASRPISQPGDVVATVQLPTGAKMESLAKAIDNIQPGTSEMLVSGFPVGIAQLTGMDLSGADLNAPISMVVLSPKKYEKPVALLVTASDLSALEKSAKSVGMTVESKNGLALIGEAAVVAASQEAAFGSLAKPGSEMVIRVYPATLMSAYKDDLHKGISSAVEMMAQQQGGPGLKPIMMAYEDMILAIGEQTEVMEIRVGSGDGASDLLFRMQPRAGTTMAALASAQVASKHELLAKLPADASGSILFSGDMRAGAARTPMIDFSMKMASAILPTTGSEDLMAMLTVWFEALDGQVAMNMSMDMYNTEKPQIDATYLMGSTDADVMRKGWRDMMKLMVANAKEGKVEMMGMMFDIGFEQKVFEVDGVEVDRYTSKLNLESLSKEQRDMMGAVNIEQNMHFATFDSYAVMAMSDDSAKTVKTAIAAARGKAPGYKVSGSMAKALQRSKDFKESMMMAMDVGSFMPAGAPPIPVSLVTMGFGQDAGALTFRMSVRK